MKWLETLNCNKLNYYMELQKTKEIVNQQKRMLSELETKVNTKSLTIDILTKQLDKNNKMNNIPTMDLLSL